MGHVRDRSGGVGRDLVWGARGVRRAGNGCGLESSSSWRWRRESDGKGSVRCSSSGESGPRLGESFARYIETFRDTLLLIETRFCSSSLHPFFLLCDD